MIKKITDRAQIGVKDRIMGQARINIKSPVWLMLTSKRLNIIYWIIAKCATRKIISLCHTRQFSQQNHSCTFIIYHSFRLGIIQLHLFECVCFEFKEILRRISNAIDSEIASRFQWFPINITCLPHTFIYKYLLYTSTLCVLSTIQHRKLGIIILRLKWFDIKQLSAKLELDMSIRSLNN